MMTNLAEIAPIVRGLLAERTGNQDIPYDPVILKSLTSKEAINFAGTAKNVEAQHYPAPLTKDQGPPLFPEALDINSPAEEIRNKLSDAVSDYSTQHNSKPKIVCFRNIGLLFVDTKEDNSASEATIADTPLRNKVALVTGAAGAIGYGICCGLLENGCHLVATDLPGKKFDSFTADLKQMAGDRVIGIPIDVTDEESVVRGLESVSLTWGGIDIVVVKKI
ncbi:MAG: SDR family NAD(P)-dependent oxidoreductase [Planctomycetota bacterium]|jgi:hypothetical protein